MATELAELIARAKAGDRAAFDEIVRQTYVDTYTLARRLTGNEEDARDVVQDAYLKAYRGIGSFRGDAAFSTWMYRITANASSTHMSRRSNRKHERLDDEDPIVETRADVDPELRTENIFASAVLQRALDELPDNLRQVIVMRDIYDLTHDEIAKQLGINEATAKVRLHRARKKMREQLFPEKGEERHAV